MVLVLVEDAVAVERTVEVAVESTAEAAEKVPEVVAERVVVVDSGSTDGTLEFLREAGIQPVHRDFTNPTEQKAHAMSQHHLLNL